MLSEFSLDCDDDGFVWSGRREEEEECESVMVCG